MKKIISMLACAALSAALMVYAPCNYCDSAFAEEASSSHKDENNKDDDNSAGALEILLIIGIFTVTFAVTGVSTYKLLRKNAQAVLPQQDKPSESNQEKISD